MPPTKKSTLFKLERILFIERPNVVELVRAGLAKTLGRHVPNRPSPLRFSTTPEDVDADFGEKVSPESQPTSFEDVKDDFEPYVPRERQGEPIDIDNDRISAETTNETNDDDNDDNDLGIGKLSTTTQGAEDKGSRH
ncbi:MAG: hypothetical protein LQ342_007201 [Letrouitia transgressa]|nr:MAG: hypothetical protein LQ342_007201 [Letrouitia transgressa]